MINAAFRDELIVLFRVFIARRQMLLCIRDRPTWSPAAWSYV